MNAVRPFLLAMLVLTLTASQPAAGQIPDMKNGGSVPTLAPLVRRVTPAVVNISVHGRVREDNPLYRDPLFREFFDVPRQIEKEVSATGSGVIVDAERGYVLTNNHVVEGTSTVQITTKDGRQFSAKVVGRDPPTDVAVLQVQNPVGLKALPFGDSDALEPLVSQVAEMFRRGYAGRDDDDQVIDGKRAHLARQSGCLEAIRFLG